MTFYTEHYRKALELQDERLKKTFLFGVRELEEN